MSDVVSSISLANLSLTFIPVVFVVYILFKWSLQAGNAIYALARMLSQLLLVGYFLAYIFASDSAWIVFGIISIMVFASSWIALDTVKDKRLVLYKQSLLSIAIGGGVVFLIVILGVLELDKWYFPKYSIPIAGMIFANSMTSVSLAAERLASEISRGVDYVNARRVALQTALIPVINSLFAVGLVSLPGMMTGQILSGVSPLIAARYQIMVMAMIFASSGISTIMFLLFAEKSITER